MRIALVALLILLVLSAFGGGWKWGDNASASPPATSFVPA